MSLIGESAVGAGRAAVERQALYEEVWTVPRIHLRAKYGLTDYEFRKLCKSLNVPLPRAGHWSRVAAGHPIARTPLPPAAAVAAERAPVNL